MSNESEQLLEVMDDPKLRSWYRIFRQKFQQTSRSTPTVSEVFCITWNLYWWLSPMVLLCSIPPIGYFVFDTVVATPEVWKMTDMRPIQAYSSHAVAITIACFLASNVAYFVGGFYLIYLQQQRQHQKSSSSSTTTTSTTTHTNNLQALGGWMMASGLISTIFHAFQAFAHVQYWVWGWAEALCYVDHGIAATAILYFGQTRGMPRGGRFWGLTILGFAALNYTIHPGYAWAHSFWHFCSAGAGVLWAVQPSQQLVRDQALLNPKHKQQ